MKFFKKIRLIIILAIIVLGVSSGIVLYVNAQSQLQSIGFVPQVSAPVVCDASSKGVIYFNSGTSMLQYCNGSVWSNVGSDTNDKVGIDSSATPDYIGSTSGAGILRTSSDLSYTDGGNYITLGVNEGNLSCSTITGSASLCDGGDANTTSVGGDLSGNQTSATVIAIQGNSISTTAPSTGQALKWNGSSWAPATDSVGSDSQTLSFSNPNLTISGGNAVDISDITVDGCTNCLNATEISDIYVFNSGDTMTGQLTVSVSGTDIVADKIDAGTVDPVYTIAGEKYATYMTGMTGVKEETTGVLKLNEKENGLWKKVIDFSKEEKGSDLWLFWQASDFGKNWDKLITVLTANFNGNIWYEKDFQNESLIIFAKPNNKIENIEVSYRLTAPRFDWKDWAGNIHINKDSAYFDGENGFVLPRVK